MCLQSDSGWEALDAGLHQKEHRVSYFVLKQNETFKFGGEKLYPSKVAVVTWLAIKEAWFLIKISVVSAEVPLLLSWPALAELGMQYDIAKGVANFARLNVQQVCLINSASGHPQVSVIGARPAHMTWPERVDWSLTEVYEPAAQEACMASSREELFFPKKVPNSVHDMLVNDEAFLSWWR